MFLALHALRALDLPNRVDQVLEGIAPGFAHAVDRKWLSVAKLYSPLMRLSDIRDDAKAAAGNRRAAH